MKKLFTLCLALMMLAACGCSTVSGEEATIPEESSKPAEQAPAASDITFSGDYSPANAFAMQMLQKALAGGKKNPVISPASAYLCLAMVMNGTGTSTLSEFESVMGGDTATVNSLCAALTAALADTAGNTTLELANSAWADDDQAVIEESFKKSVTDWYDAGLYTADLPSDAALKAINEWVNEKTHGLIPTLHDTNYPENTVLVLLNTLYFKAKWQEQFEGYRTFDNTFTRADGTTLETPFMNEPESDKLYINTDGAEGIVLPYDDGKTAFMALRPTDGSGASDFAAALDAGRLAAYLDSAAETSVVFSMPKFTIEYEINLNKALAEMGLSSMFDPERADLTPMGRGVDWPLYISQVIQKVKIEVNEEGTEAAAVTEAFAATGAFMPEELPVELHLDSPFLYAVMDLDSGLPLFIGVLDEPTT